MERLETSRDEGEVSREGAEVQWFAFRVAYHPEDGHFGTIIWRCPGPDLALLSLKEEIAMAATPSFPYETRLNVLHKSLEVIDEKALADACEFTWYNQTLSAR